MTFFEQTQPIEDRVLVDTGMEMFRAVMEMEQSLITPSPAKIARKLRWHGNKAAEVAYRLENAGLVDLVYNGPYMVQKIHLTDKGREMAHKIGCEPSKEVA